MLIYIVMFIGIVISIIGKFPSAIKVERRALYEEMYGDIIECAFRDAKLSFKRAGAIVLMIASLWLTIITSSYVIAGIGCILYCILVVVHYRICYRLDRKIYCGREGIWFDKPKGKMHLYQELTIDKSWRTTVPFSGYSDWLEVMFTLNGKQYTIAAPNDENCPELDLLKWAPDIKKHEMDDNEKRKYSRTGLAGILLGLCMMTVSAWFVLASSGAENTMTMEDDAYKIVLEEEQAMHGEVTTIHQEDGRIYALFDGFGAVNVYNEDGRFLHAYKIPLGDNGSIRMAVENQIVYIKNRDDFVFLYSDDRYLGCITLEEFKGKGYSFAGDDENLDLLKVIDRRSSPGMIQNNAIPLFAIGLMILIYSVPLFHKGRLSV